MADHVRKYVLLHLSGKSVIQGHHDMSQPDYVTTRL